MKPVIVVTGMPRSGTSMMMRMLEQGGVPCSYQPDNRPALRNPNGCYEGGKIPQDGGVAVKQFRIIPEHDCYYIFMYRNPLAISRSWDAVSKLGNCPAQRQNSMESLSKRQQASLERVQRQKNVVINYDAVVDNPVAELQKVKDFIPFPFDVEKASLVVDRGLYIKRQGEDDANASGAKRFEFGNDKTGGSVEQSTARPDSDVPRTHFRFDMAYGWGRPAKNI